MMALAIFARGHSGFTAENGCEVLTGGEAQRVGDVCDILLGAGQAPVRFLDATVDEIFVQGVTGLRLEPRTQTGGTQPDIGGDGIQSHFVVENPPFQPFEGAPHPPGDHRFLFCGLLVLIVILFLLFR